MAILGYTDEEIDQGQAVSTIHPEDSARARPEHVGLSIPNVSLGTKKGLHRLFRQQRGHHPVGSSLWVAVVRAGPIASRVDAFERHGEVDARNAKLLAVGARRIVDGRERIAPRWCEERVYGHDKPQVGGLADRLRLAALSRV